MLGPSLRMKKNESTPPLGATAEWIMESKFKFQVYPKPVLHLVTRANSSFKFLLKVLIFD